MVTAAYQRMEQVFDVIQENPRNFKGDNYLLRYLAELSTAAERLEKLRLGTDAAMTNPNMTMEAVEEYTLILQETVREVLVEIDPDTAMLFMEKLHNKLSKLKPPQPMTCQEQLSLSC